MSSNCRGKVIWLYGRPCSGKSTLSSTIAEVLKQNGKLIVTLDGDDLRKGINSDLGFTLADRFENIRRAAETARLMAKQDFWVICSFVTPTHELRDLVKKTLTGLDYVLINIYASLDVCIERDVKGHYSEAQKQSLLDFTGISSPFEEPKRSENIIDTTELNVDEATRKCIAMILN